MFYEREGGEIAVRQDRILEAAVRIADATITFQADYYKPSDDENMFHLSTNSRYIEPQDFMSLSPLKISPRFVKNRKEWKRHQNKDTAVDGMRSSAQSHTATKRFEKCLTRRSEKLKLLTKDSPKSGRTLLSFLLLY